jgi:hypothetical protein
MSGIIIPERPRILTPTYDEPEEFFVNHEDYWHIGPKPRGYAEWTEMYETKGKVTGLWELTQWDPKTGRVKRRVWNKNVVTDNGAIQLLTCAIANAVPAAVFNNLYINNNGGSSTLSAASGTSAISTGANLAVVAIPAQVPLNYPSPANAVVTQLTLGFGSGTTQTISMNATTAALATALNIVGFTPTINFPIGTAVVPLPNVQENPSNANLKANQSSVVEQYSGVIAAGGFVTTQTAGLGNRQIVVTFTFKTATNGGSTAVGNYTDTWLVNVTSAAAANNYICHEINVPMRCDNSNNLTATVTIKL